MVIREYRCARCLSDYDKPLYGSARNAVLVNGRELVADLLTSRRRAELSNIAGTEQSRGDDIRRDVGLLPVGTNEAAACSHRLRKSDENKVGGKTTSRKSQGANARVSHRRDYDYRRDSSSRYGRRCRGSTADVGQGCGHANVHLVPGQSD